MATKRKKVRNPIARDLRQPKYRTRVVRNRRAYDRKRWDKVEPEGVDCLLKKCEVVSMDAARRGTPRGPVRIVPDRPFIL